MLGEHLNEATITRLGSILECGNMTGQASCRRTDKPSAVIEWVKPHAFSVCCGRHFSQTAEGGQRSKITVPTGAYWRIPNSITRATMVTRTVLVPIAHTQR